MRRLFVTVLAALIVAGCVTTRGTPDERRAAIREMRTDVVTELYRQKASARAELAAAPGYGVFSNANVNVVLASFGVGLGAGVKDYRLVFVFHDADTMRDFVDKGWAFGGQADAAAKAGEQGAAVGGEAILDDVTVYQLTESGLALQATVKGTKYWKDSALN